MSVSKNHWSRIFSFQNTLVRLKVQKAILVS